MKNSNNKLDISVYITVRNEEHRIKACISRLFWVKEIIIFDKESSDNTAEICREHGAIVISVPNTPINKKGIELFRKIGSGKWCLFLTASDLVGEKLKNVIEKAIKKAGVHAISLPYLAYNFGNYVQLNPFSKNSKVLLLRRKNVVLSNNVHEEIGYSKKKILKIPQPAISDHDSYVIHLANENIEEYFNKFPRYLEKEAISWKDLSIKENIILLIRSILNALFLRPSYIFGIRGVVYTTSYLSYIFARFTVLTFNKHKKDNLHLYKPYEQIRNKTNKKS